MSLEKRLKQVLRESGLNQSLVEQTNPSLPLRETIRLANGYSLIMQGGVIMTTKPLTRFGKRLAWM